MINKIKRPLSIVLVVMMVVSLFTIVPISASAAEETKTVTWDNNIFRNNRDGLSSGDVTLTTTQDNTRVGDCFYEGRGSATFTAPEGSVFTKIELKNCTVVDYLNFPGATVAESGGYWDDEVNPEDPEWVQYYTITWTGEASEVTFSGDIYTIQSFVFTLAPAPTGYTVTWKNGDTTLKTDTVDKDAIPAYNGETPTKPENENYTYTFSGWTDGTNTYGATDTLPAVTGDVTYTATFTATPKVVPKVIVADETFNIGDSIAFNDAPPFVYVRYDDDTSSDYTAYLIGGDNTTVTEPTYDARGGQWKFNDVLRYDPWSSARPLRITGIANRKPIGFKVSGGTGTQSDPFTFAAVYEYSPADDVIDMINALPAVVTLDDKAAVEAARQAYNDLTDDQKNLVTDETLETLAAAEKVVADREGAKAVEDMINALPDAKDITLADKAAVNAANEARLNLPPEQADYLTFAAIDKLFKAMEKIEDLEAAKAVEDQINALPDTVTSENKQTFKDVMNAFHALTYTQADYIPQETQDKLTNAFFAVSIVEGVENIPDEVTLENKALVNNLYVFYNEAKDEVKSFVNVDAVNKLFAAKKSVDDLEAAKDATDKINALPENITVEDKEAVEAARAAFDALTDDQRALVDVDALSEKLAAAEAALKVVLDKAAADAVIAQIDALPAATGVTINDKDAIDGAKAAYDALTDDQKKLVPLRSSLKLAADIIVLAIAEKDVVRVAEV